MKTLTITGAFGFVGTNLTTYLQHKHYTVHPLSLRTQHWKKEINPSVDAIIHLAGKAHDTNNTTDASEYFKVNTELTKELFDWYLQSSVKDFFFFSTVKAVVDVVRDELTEDVVGNPVTPYGQSKLKAEAYILSKPLPDGKRVFIVRPCMIHGPGNKGNLNLLYNVVKKGIPWPLATYSNRRSFLSIDNLNYIIDKMLMDEEIESGVYNMADDVALSTNELVILIAETLGRRPRLWNVNKKLINSIARIGDQLNLPLDSERLAKLTESYVVSNAKVKQALGVDKLPVTARQGIEKTIRWFGEE